MDFDLNEMQQMLLDSAERVMKPRTSVELWRARHGLADGLDSAAWAQFAALGWLALPLPEAAGGLGGSLTDVAFLMTALGRGLAVEPYVSSVILGGHILAGAPGEGFTGIIEGIASGSVRLALAHGEAGSGYDLALKRDTTARPEGTGHVVSGVKSPVLDAPSATHLIVSASLEDAQTALFLVPADTRGVTIEAYPVIDGSRAADVRVQDVVLGPDMLIARGNAATMLVEEASDRAAIAHVAQAVGAMEACLDLCSDYLKERRQFGQPIGKFQALQHMLVDMLVATNQSRSALYGALAAIDAEPPERAHAVSAAKVVAGEAMQFVSRTGVQLHGGFGVTDEYPISHYYRRLIVLEKLNGDIAHHLDRMTRFPPPSDYQFYHP
jgi:alkylation response protein AidB-like acyl-CoA dehydrogenase